MRSVKRLGYLALIIVILLTSGTDLLAYRLTYKEQLYKLYHRQLYMANADITENIHWLEEALKADFANPLNALAIIKDQREWEKYRYLFNMHLNLLMIDQYLLLASRYNKQEAYFFNAPWRDLNLESLDKAESLFRFALVYWEEAEQWARRAESFRWVHLEELQAWEDELFRISDGSLDYQKIIDRHLGKLVQVRQTFKNMDANTY